MRLRFVTSGATRSQEETLTLTCNIIPSEAMIGSSSSREAVTRSRRTLGAAGSSTRAVNDKEVEEGFTRVTHRRSNIKSKFTGGKKGTNLRSVQQVRNIRIFVCRLEARLTADILKDYFCELIGDECTVSKLATKYPTYSSFMVICDDKYKEAIMNPDEWEEGVFVMRYFNRTRPSMRSGPNLVSNTPPNVHDG